MDQEVRLSRYEEGESLQRRRHINLRINESAATAFYLTEIVNVAIRRDRPQHVGRVDASQFVRTRQVVNAQRDAGAAAALAPHRCRSLQARQARGAVKWNFNRLVERIRDRQRGPRRVALT